jgi:hypothetical protein
VHQGKVRKDRTTEEIKTGNGERKLPEAFKGWNTAIVIADSFHA